ncbi:MAG: zinc carboxypeptidase, partial [Planctomycetes bacterium]|nr:zinc carboxypeptidase [Planctomycetota bacterium]
MHHNPRQNSDSKTSLRTAFIHGSWSMTRCQRWCCLLMLSLFGMTASAQNPLLPEAYFGYELGARYTPHDRALRWLDAVAAASDRVSIERYGQTTEGRDLTLVFLTSAQNQARLEDLRERMALLADPRRLADGQSADEVIEDLPVFVWLSYNVHGNETSCTEAALRVVTELAFSEAPEVLQQLQESVVILDPCVNPDGRDRYVNWFNSVVGRRGDPNPQSMEHDEPWPGGRYNHYGFDLNRDWAFMSQIETRSRIPRMVLWNPQVHVDFHEMSAESSYFFFPADRPINANLPHHTVKWGEIFGRGNAQAFDERAWDYYTAEGFDLFYPGYGDSWPSLQGAIGMTYEQAGHGRAGISYRRRDDSVLTLADRVEHHFVASMATLRTALQNRVALLTEYHDFRRSAIEEGKGGPIREFILLPGNDSELGGGLVNLLIAQGVEVRQTSAEIEARDIHDFNGVTFESRKLPAGSYLISMAQPTKRLIKTLLEPRTTIRELYFYDVSAWSLPFAFGVEALWSGEAMRTVDSLITQAPKVVGTVAEGASTYGWLASWEQMATVRAALQLLQAGVQVRVATEEFTLAGRNWPRGTLFVPRGGQPADVAAAVAKAAVDTGAQLAPAATGMTEKGIDLGSS